MASVCYLIFMNFACYLHHLIFHSSSNATKKKRAKMRTGIVNGKKKSVTSMFPRVVAGTIGTIVGESGHAISYGGITTVLGITKNSSTQNQATM